MDKQIKATGITLGLLWIFWPKKGAAKTPDLSDVSIAPLTTPSPTGAEGAMNESFLGSTGLPRGIRNNNPGNIKIGSSQWQGKIPVAQNTDGTFEQFSSFPLGARAMIKLLKNYINQGRNTPTKIIQYWDLGSPSYTSFLIQETGFTANQILQPDKPTLKALSQAIAKFENGQDILTDIRFETAYALV